MTWKVTDLPSPYLYVLHDDNLGTVSENQFVPIRFCYLLSPHFFIFVRLLNKFKDIRLMQYPGQRYNVTKRNAIWLARFIFFRTSHFYTLGDGHKSNWYFRRHALPPSSGPSGEVSNHLVGPTTWRTSFTLVTICNKEPKRNCALLPILPGGAARECLQRQTNSKY